MRIFTKELIRILSTDCNKEIRKLAITCIHFDDDTFSCLLKRLRDFDPEIPFQVFRKLNENNVALANLELCDIYHLL